MTPHPADIAMPNLTGTLAKLADACDRLTADGPPNLTQLAARVALVEAAIVILADTSPNREDLAAVVAGGGCRGRA